MRRRIASYGVCLDERGRVLLVRASGDSLHTGRWLLPGGGVEHGEHPADAVVREIAEETGLRVMVTRARTVRTDVVDDPRGGRLHHDRLIFDVALAGGELRDEPVGSTDTAAWVEPEMLVTLPLMPFAAAILGVSGSAGPEPAPQPPAGNRSGQAPPGAPAGAARSDAPAGAARSDTPAEEGGVPDPDAAAPVRRRFQRFAAYGLVTDPAGLVLLARIAPGYPGAGRWHLPGGGTDHGESAEDGLLRELVEETGQHGRVVELLTISHRHHTSALGPEGVPIDWHGVRVVFRVAVDAPTAPWVVEATGGSTVAAAWYPVTEALRLSLTEVAEDSIRRFPR